MLNLDVQNQGCPRLARSERRRTSSQISNLLKLMNLRGTSRLGIIDAISLCGQSQRSADLQAIRSKDASPMAKKALLRCSYQPIVLIFHVLFALASHASLFQPTPREGGRPAKCSGFLVTSLRRVTRRIYPADTPPDECNASFHRYSWIQGHPLRFAIES